MAKQKMGDAMGDKFVLLKAAHARQMLPFEPARRKSNIHSIFVAQREILVRR